MLRRTLAALAAFVLAGSAQAADWKMESATSALDGQQTASATLDSDNDIPNLIGRPEKAALIVRCSQRRLEAYIAWPGFVGSDMVTGAYRVDGGGIQTIGLHTSTDGTATFFTDRVLTTLLPALMSGRQLVVRITPDREAPEEATWTLGEARAPIFQVVNACR